jgi:hypothetical protein
MLDGFKKILIELHATPTKYLIKALIRTVVWFPYQTISVSFKSNRMGATTSGAGFTNPSRAPEFIANL